MIDMEELRRVQRERDAKVDWRKQPRGGDFEIVNEYESAGIRASTSRSQDKVRLAGLLDCRYIEVRDHFVYFYWDAVDAEANWRQDGCECEDGPHYPGPMVGHPPEECATTKPAEDVYDFWDETGSYCPWVRCEKDHPDAVRFRWGEYVPSKVPR